MSLFGRLKNIFTSNSNSNNDNKKRQKHSLIKFDVDPNELWEIVGELGDGAFGKVYKAKHKVQQIYAALKQVDINDETELDDCGVEIDILHQCKHKNIVGLHEAYFFGGKLWMFIEFCGGGALDGIMLELEKPLTEPQIRYVCREMCEALDFLHQHFVIHRDLKAGNVLLTCEGEVKLADFGVSARNSSYRQKRDTFIGTPYWMAPEVILCETIKDSPYDFKADIWSFGITLIEFAQIEPPNSEMHPMRVLVKIQKSEPPTLKFPSRWSKEFNDFVGKCLLRDPEQRPTAGDLLQHPFIRDVKGSQPIMELVSEANAEIILEEKDMDDDLDEGIDLDNRSGATTDVDSDSISTASGSNILKPNGAEEDNISDTSPAAGDTGKAPLPIIVVGGGGEGISKSQSSKEPEKRPVSAAASDEKGLKTAEPQQGTLTEGTSPEEEEPVILRKKKSPPAGEIDKTPSPEEATDSPTGQKKYRTLTKTRKYMVNGEVVMSKVSKIIVPGSATDKKQQEHLLWKADLRELKLLHKQEKKLLQDMELKSLAAVDEQNRKFDQDNGILLRNAECSLDQLSKQHRQQMERMTMNHVSDMKNMQKKTRQEQDKDLKSFNESLKQELKLLRQEVDLLPKDARKDAFQQRKREKEIEHAEKERKFIEQQKDSMIRALKRVEDQQKDQVALAERQYLQLKQQTIRAREVSLWEAEVCQLRDRNRLNVSQLDSKFMLKKQLMMTRHAKELEQVQRINASKEEELLQCHLLENKRLPKIMKNEGKTRALMFKQSIRISVMGITADQEKEKIKQFEETEKRRLKEEETRLRKKHKRQMDELRAKNEAVVKELEQVHAEKRKMLEDNEAQKRKELEDQFQKDLNNMQMGQIPKKEALEATFAQEMADNEKFYANGSSVDQDTGKGLKSGVAHIVLPNVSQVPSAAKPPSKVSPGSGKKLPASEASKEMTLPVVTSGKTSAEHGPAPATKASEEKLPVSTAKVPEKKILVTSAKVPEEKVPVPVAKVPEEKVPVAKVPEEKVPVPVAKVPEEKVPVPVAKVPEEKVPVPVAKVSEEQVLASVCDSSVGRPSVAGQHLGIDAVSAVSEASEKKSEKPSPQAAIPVSLSVEEKVSSVAATAIEIHPTDAVDRTSESKASEPVVPCATSADAIAPISLHQHQDIPQSSSEQNSSVHSKVAVELLQPDAIVTDAVPTAHVSSQDKGHVEKTDELDSNLESGEKSLLHASPVVKIESSSVSLEELSGEKLQINPSATVSLSSALTESSTADKFLVAEVIGLQGQDEGTVEEGAAVFTCQTEVSPPCPSGLSQDVINTEPNSEMPATDVTDQGPSEGSIDRGETTKTKMSLEVRDSHQARSDGELHETSDPDVEKHSVSLQSREPHHETRDAVDDDSCIHSEKIDVGHTHSDPFQKEKSLVQEQIETHHEKSENHHEKSETAHEDNSEKREETIGQEGTVHHEESDAAQEVCDAGDEKKDSPDDITSYSRDHSDHHQKSDTSIEFVKPNPQVIDSSHKHDDGHHDKCSEIVEESCSSGKAVDDDDDDEEGVVDMYTDEDFDASYEESLPQDMQAVSSSHQQKDGNSLPECSEPCLEKDDSSHDKETDSSSGPLTLLAEVTGALEEKDGSLLEKSESSAESKDGYLEDNNTTSPEKKDSTVLSEEKSKAP